MRVFTKLSRRIPFAVRTFLGTDLPGIGFNVVYKRQEDGVWFPSTFGTEFRIHVLFFINREMTVSLENKGFQRTHVESKMKVIGPGVRVKRQSSRPYDLVAAGVVLRGDQDQARTARFRLRVAAERVQDADDRDIRGENAEANGCDDGDEEENGHYERDHGRPTLEIQSLLRLSHLLVA